MLDMILTLIYITTYVYFLNLHIAIHSHVFFTSTLLTHKTSKPLQNIHTRHSTDPFTCNNGHKSISRAYLAYILADHIMWRKAESFILFDAFEYFA